MTSERAYGMLLGIAFLARMAVTFGYGSMVPYGGPEGTSGYTYMERDFFTALTTDGLHAMGWGRAEGQERA